MQVKSYVGICFILFVATLEIKIELVKLNNLNLMIA